MAVSPEKLCTICDPSSIKATEWCSDCGSFLCADCTSHHKKLLKEHVLFSVDTYQQLPSFLQDLKLTCEEHDERIDAYCPIHKEACCFKCAFETHRFCEGIGLLKDFISNSKSSSTIKAIAIDINDIRRFVKDMADDRLQNKADVIVERESIMAEIENIQSGRNSKLVSVKTELKDILNKHVQTINDNIDDVVRNLRDLEHRVVGIQDDYHNVKEKASDRQTFLSVEYFVSNLLKEDNQIAEWAQDGKFKRMKLVSNIKDLELPNLSPLGLIEIKAEDNTFRYLKTKDQHAQMLGMSTVLSKSLRVVKSFPIPLEDTTNMITGCEFAADGNIVIGQFNDTKHVDTITLHDVDNGFFLHRLPKGDIGTLSDLCSIENKEIAFTTEHGIFIIDQSSRDYTHSLTFSAPQPAGLVHGSGYIFFVSIEEGIRKYERATKTNTLIVSDDKVRKSYISHHNGNVCYTVENTIKCCDENGELIWECEDEVLESPRGLAMDKDGYLYVVCTGSENIVMISPNGKCVKEIATVENGSVICCDKEEQKLLVCTDSNLGHIYEICDIFDS